MTLKEYLDLNCEIIPSINLLRLQQSEIPMDGYVKAYLPPMDALVEGILDITKCKVTYIPKERLKYCLQKGDILIKCQNGTLITIVNDDNIICSSNVIGVKIKEEKHLYELVYTLTSNEFYKIGARSHVALVNRINTNEIMNFVIKPSRINGELIYKSYELKNLIINLHELKLIELEEMIKSYKKLNIKEEK